MPLTCQPLKHNPIFSTVSQTKRQRIVHVHSTLGSSHQPTTLDNSRRLAYFRAQETLLPSPLLTDPYASPLAETFSSSYPPSDPTELATAAFDMISARFIDDQVLLALNSVNTGRNQPYNQLVLVGDGYCTRPFRLNLPVGTIIYLVAPGEVHERAEALLAEQPVKARVPRGCLLKRVDCDIVNGNSCAIELQRAGYRADRVSVWALQGIRQLLLTEAAISSIFADMSNLAALESLLFGELPATTPAGVENVLASFGLLGTHFEPESVAHHIETTESSTSWWDDAISAGICAEIEKIMERPLLFRAQQRRLSLQEIEMYESHVSAAEEVDEDFFGNFS